MWFLIMYSYYSCPSKYSISYTVRSTRHIYHMLLDSDRTITFLSRGVISGQQTRSALPGQYMMYLVLCRFDRIYTKINADIKGCLSAMPMFHFPSAGPNLPPGTESNRHRFIFF